MCCCISCIVSEFLSLEDEGAKASSSTVNTSSRNPFGKGEKRKVIVFDVPVSPPPFPPPVPLCVGVPRFTSSTLPPLPPSSLKSWLPVMLYSCLQQGWVVGRCWSKLSVLLPARRHRCSRGPSRLCSVHSHTLSFRV